MLLLKEEVSFVNRQGAGLALLGPFCLKAIWKVGAILTDNPHKDVTNYTGLMATVDQLAL